jgi:UDP-N-acetylmuramyl pentapeptide phosphotransferase/UDP-N-acetylglucosamine-1-phosphate transferase
MVPRRSIRHLFAPWTGLVVGLAALIIVHQFGSQGTFDDCQTIAPIPVLAVAAAGLVACLAAGLFSWRSAGDSDSGTRRLIAIISLGSALLFAFAIVLAAIATIMLPRCFQ